MAAIPADLDPNDPINILLRPFDAIPKPAAAPADDVDPNKTEEFMKKVGGGTKVRQCPSFRMLEFQIQYEDYKQTKTAVS